MTRSSRSTSRRRFLALVGAAGLSTSLVPPMAALAQSASRSVPKPPLKPDPAAPAKPDGATPPPPPSEFAEDAKSLTTVIGRRYGKHLDAHQLEQIKKEIDGRMQAGKVLRTAKLANHDEPDFAFHA